MIFPRKFDISHFSLISNDPSKKNLHLYWENCFRSLFACFAYQIQENSERIVIFPRKIRNFAFFFNPKRSEQGKLAPLLGKLLSLAIRLLCVSNSKENSERIVIFPMKIRNFAFFVNPKRSEQGKFAPLLRKLLSLAIRLLLRIKFKENSERIVIFPRKFEISHFSLIPNDPSKEN